MPETIKLETLTEEQQSFMTTLAEAWPQLTELQRGKLLGYAEAKAENRREEKKCIA